MWIINKHPPFIHKLHAEIKMAFTLIGFEEARELVNQLNRDLELTGKNAEAVRETMQGILKDTQEVAKKSPHYDPVEDAGVG